MRRAQAVAFIVAAIALALAASGSAGSASSAVNPQLIGTVGTNDAFVITLTDSNGNPVTTLPAGTYDILIHDQSTIHNFHLTGPGVDIATTVSGTGDTTSTVNLSAGSYHFQCDPHAEIMFGDFTVQALAARVTSFSASRAGRGVVVRWRTGSEIDTLGFNVYRQRGNRRVRLNRPLIPALSLTRGGISGGSYSYIDRRAPRSELRYWLEEVDAAGRRTRHGPVRVSAV